jgi:predicted short-subunit dehydrogenase-like oxidoreductase (DUF2520 family)
MVSTPAPDSQRPSIAIIGLGRVGSVLGRALHEAGYRIVAVSSRDSAKAARIAAAWQATPADPAAAARSADLTLLAIPDDALQPVAADLAARESWRSGQSVIHASGALPASAIQPATSHGALIGSLHPLAAFATAEMTLPRGITFAVEAGSPLRETLLAIAGAIGGRPLLIDSRDKTLYHAAAVIASNYTVTLAAIATRLMQQLGATGEQGLDAILPLLRTTLDNLERQGLPAALTGPLVRGDVGTIERHLHALDRAAPPIAEFYRCLAQGTLPLAQARGLSADAAGALRDAITLPGEMLAGRGDAHDA